MDKHTIVLTARAVALAVTMTALAGCASFFDGPTHRAGVSSSVVDYLYPPGTKFEAAQEGVPEVRLPARVGLMFVPSTREPDGLTAADRQQLLAKVRDTFKASPSSTGSRSFRTPTCVPAAASTTWNRSRGSRAWTSSR